MIEEIQIETRPQPAILLMDLGEYFKLNHALSLAEGFDLSKDTQRAKTMTPEAAKVNIEYDEDGNELSYDIKFVMKITSKEQEDYPELFAGFELVKNYIPCEDEITEILAEGLTSVEVDWTLQHSAKVGFKKEGLVMLLDDEPGTALSDSAVQKLNDSGIIVITPAP